MVRRWMLLVGCMLCAALLPGCINYEELLTLNRDGSGTVTMHYWMNTEFIDQLAAGVEAKGTNSLRKSGETNRGQNLTVRQSQWVGEIFPNNVDTTGAAIDGRTRQVSDIDTCAGHTGGIIIKM